MKENSYLENPFIEFTPIKPLLAQFSPEDQQFIGYDQTKTARDRLEIYKSQHQLLYLVKTNDVVVFTGPPGSGKTSQLPQILYSAGYATDGQIICVVLPSRVSVVSAAHRVAGELRTEVGLGVGFSYKFHSKMSDHAKIKFTTYGSLLQEIQLDPLLSRYSVIILDDFHERSIEQDVALFLAKAIAKRRKTSTPQLKFIVMSAALESQRIVSYLESKDRQNDAELSAVPFQIQGALFPVRVFYSEKPVPNILQTAASLVAQLHLQMSLEHDFLVFLPGVAETENFCVLVEQIFTARALKHFSVLAVHSGLRLADQMKMFEQRDKSSSPVRRIIAATGVAQTGITIETVSVVVDTLLERIHTYDPLTNSVGPKTIFASQFTAEQRAGRAGRVRPGVCYRLATKPDFEQLPRSPVPQIAFSKLEFFYLYLRSIEISNFSELNLLSAFSRNNLLKALEQLSALRLIDLSGSLTNPLGTAVALLPLEPVLSTLLLNSFKPEFACSEEILSLVSMLAAGSPFFSSREPGSVIKTKKLFGAKEGDLLTLSNLLAVFNSMGAKEKRQFCAQNCLNESVLLQAREIRERLTGILAELGKTLQSSASESESILRCICSAFFTNVAQSNSNGSYRILTESSAFEAFLNPTSIANTNFPRWLVFCNLEIGAGEGQKSYITNVSEIHPEWLTEMLPEYFEDTKLADAENQRMKEIKGKEEELPRIKLAREEDKVAVGKIPESLAKKQEVQTKSAILKKRNVISMLNSDEEI